jgi:hypothetical protein
MTNYTPYSEGFRAGQAFERERIANLLEAEARTWLKPVRFNYRLALGLLAGRVRGLSSDYVKDAQ